MIEKLHSIGVRHFKWGLLLFIIVIRLIEIGSRDELHADEVYSVLISQCNPAFYTAISDGTYSGDDLQRELIATHSLSEDVRELYLDNHDVPHASLYYMALRCCLTGYDEWQPAEVALRGGLLNLLFLIISYLILWKLLASITGNNWITMACCAIAFLNPASGECVVLVREYQFAMLAVIWFTASVYKVIQLLQTDEENGRRLKYIVSLVLSIALLLSTGYLNIYYLIVLPLAMAVVNFWKAPRQTGRFVLGMLVSGLYGLILAWLIYNGYFNFITHNSVHKSRAFSSFIPSLTAALQRDSIYDTLTMGFAVFLCILLCFNCLRWIRKKKEPEFMAVVFPVGFLLEVLVSVLITVVAVQYTSLLREARYSYPYLPLLCVSLPVSVYRLSKRFCKWVSLITICYFMVISMVTVPTKKYGWQTQRELLADGAVFHNLNANELPLLYPTLTPDAQYKIEHTRLFPKQTVNTIVIHHNPSRLESAYRTVKRVTGPLRVLKSTKSGL